MDTQTMTIIQLTLLVDLCLAVSYNQPKFSPCATWNSTGTTFATSTIVGAYPQGIFVDTNNSVYVANYQYGAIHVWLEGNMTPSQNISGISIDPASIFVNIVGDIYVDNGKLSKQVDRWAVNAITSEMVMYITESCLGLFIDLNNTIYCSLRDRHLVVKKSLKISTNSSITAAGTGCAGRLSNTLTYPNGIFVDSKLSLYIADSGNNRIQFFLSGQLNGTTIVGSVVPNTFSLHYPTGVILDADDYLFIADSYNNRIIGSSLNGYRCLVGCSGLSGSASNQLFHLQTINFDSYGNMFVADRNNQRIQKFNLVANYCVETSTNVINRDMVSTSASTINEITMTDYGNSMQTTVSIINKSFATSFNRPKFSPYASWNSNGITFANNSIIGNNPFGLFVDINNTVYVNNINNGRIIVWLEGNSTPARIVSDSKINAFSLFVSTTGDIYVDHGVSNCQIDKWAVNGGNSETVMYISSFCAGLFIAIDNSIYCSVLSVHQVVKKLADSDVYTTSIVAGTGCAGSSSNMLNGPYGIYVDTNFSLYVADCLNNRIQLFRSGELNGTTVAGSGAPGTITLRSPVDVTLDDDGYLFIVDFYNQRIVGSGPYGFRCLVGCSQISGSAFDQLNGPHQMSFDSYGNIFVTDSNNNRIQKFLLLTNSSTTSPSISTDYTTKVRTTSTITTTNAFSLEQTNKKTKLFSTWSSTVTAEQTTVTNLSHFLVPNSTLFHTLVLTSPPLFVPPTCNNSYYVGTTCNISIAPCNVLQPCENAGNCTNDINASGGYLCHCTSGFNGTNCQYDTRPCKPNTCWNNGTCLNTSSIDFVCLCAEGWTGDHCEIKVNYCQNITCANNGICRPLFRDYECECLTSSYSGRHCEITSNSLTTRKTVSRSFGYIAILFIISVYIFVLILDILKYVFHIDPIHRQIRVKEKKSRIAIRFLYVHEKPVISITEETIV